MDTTPQRYTVAPLHASASRLALAPRYSTLDSAWDAITPGTVVRDGTGAVVAGHADMLRWLTPSLVGA